MYKRVVVTGIGVVSPIGIGKADYWNNLISGKSGIDTITSFDASNYPSTMAAEVKNFNASKCIDPKRAINMDRSTQFIVTAAKLAIKDSSLAINEKNSRRIQVITGTTLGGLSWILEQHRKLLEKGLDRVHKYTAGLALSNAHSGEISIELGIKGASETFSSACASMFSAISYAFKKIQECEADIVVVGGGEAPIAPLSYGTLCVLGVHSKNNKNPASSCRPFSIDRDGMVLGEGAGVMILEEYEHAIKRKANIYAEVIGIGITCEAYNMFHHENGAREASHAIEMAINNSSINIDEITFINAHGLGIPKADTFEALAIKNIFKNINPKVTSIKSSVGHALAAGGAIQLISSVLSIQNDIIPPTISFTTVDNECSHLDIVTKAEKIKVESVLTNCFAFHGKDAALVLKKIK